MSTTRKTKKSNMDEIPYSMIYSYAGNWGYKEMARELEANARDTHTPVKVYVKDNTLIIEDSGEGIKPHHLLLGEHENRTGESIGQFGEGLKLAFMLSIKLNLPMIVYSHDYIYHTEKTITAGKNTFKIVYTWGNPSVNGTRVEVSNWEYPTYYDELFLDESTIIFSTLKGSIIAKSSIDDISKIYVKGVFVKESSEFGLSYNLIKVSMQKGRSTLENWEINNQIGEIIAQCEDSKIWELFFKAIESGKQETNITIREWYMSDASKKAMKLGFEKVFGVKTVLQTSIDKSVDAIHRGVHSVISEDKFGTYIREIVSSEIGTDESYLKEVYKEKYQKTTTHKISPEQKVVLGYLRKICKKVGFNAHTSLKIASKDARHPGIFHPSTGIIDIREDMLWDLQKSIDVLTHELGHWYDQKIHGETNDNSDNHVNAITAISAMIITGYAIHDRKKEKLEEQIKNRKDNDD